MFGNRFKYITLTILLVIIKAQDFSPGPYGINFLDIAGPFILEDLNVRQTGDIDGNRIIDLKDILTYSSYLDGDIELSEEQILFADINSDGSIDIIDVILDINQIFNPMAAFWNFEEHWTGAESYIFITSPILWNQNLKLDLLQNSPMNIHYIFISNLDSYQEDMVEVKSEFDEILQYFPIEEKEHWLSHLHFSSKKLSDYDNWLPDGLSNHIALGINSLQQLQEIGYLGNPDGFVGNYLSYLAHEAVYYDYQERMFGQETASHDTITVFDKEIYTGGWASTISKLVEFPSDEILDQYSSMSVELLRGCPDANGNYSDDGCDDYDRIARMFICEEDESNCQEIARWITPFDRQPHHLTDISSFISMIRPGGNKIIKFQESGWPNSLLTLRFRFYHETEIDPDERPQTYQPMWIGTVGFNPDYDDNRPPMVFNVPDEAIKVEFVAYITGHGWGSNGCYNCAEFCNSNHIFSLNGGVYEFNKAHPEGEDSDYCMELETIAQGVKPNQHGTWGYGRAGWCPGLNVNPYIIDITNYVTIGDENIMDYTACRVTWNDCVEPPICQGDGYCPEIAMSSYIIIWY